MGDLITARHDPDSPTAGIQEAIDSLDKRGGIVRVPSGVWGLRRSVVVRDSVSIEGDGPATVLAAGSPSVLKLTSDARKGGRSIRVQGRIPYLSGDDIGVIDRRRQWWDGTHALVTSVEGSIVRLSSPLTLGVKVKDEARISSMFPAITTDGAGGPGARGRSHSIVIRDLAIRGGGARRAFVWDFTYSAIHLVSCHHSRIASVSVSDWPSDGIGVQGGSDVQVTNCQVSMCDGNGLHPGTGLRRSIWSQNIATGNGWDGMFVCGNVVDSTFTSNVFTGNGKSGVGGVGHAGDHHNVISDNVCSENGQCGIDAFDGVEHVITGNILRANSQERAGKYPAIRLHSVERFLVQGNRCADNEPNQTQSQGIVESGASDWNLVNANMCVGMTEPIRVTGRNSIEQGNLT